MANYPVLLTKINPPPASERTLARPRITAALLEGIHHRLTLVQAGAGYGKSTAVNSLVGRHDPLIWYQISREDADPYVFLQHLLHATLIALPKLETLPIPFLESWDGSQGPLPTREVLYRFLNELNEGLQEHVLLIMEDVHLACTEPEIVRILDSLISLAPAHLHFILTTRVPLDLAGSSKWLARGQILTIDQDLLAFTTEEIKQLFMERYKHALNSDEIEFLADATEGWAITLQLIGQSMGSRSVQNVRDALNFPSASLDALFEILAKEVLVLQPKEVREFMKRTSILNLMDPGACDALLGLKNSAQMLQKLVREDLFVVQVAEDAYRYHHIFHRFLRQQLTTQEAQDGHRNACEYYREEGELDTAFYHALKAGDVAAGAEILIPFGETLLRSGRYTTLTSMLDSLAPETLKQHPTLLFFLGDLARLHSRFQEALGWYQQAEALWRDQGQMEGVSRALRGQARVYLDTVDPSKAEQLLQQALRISDGTADRDTMANLYELLAENRLNAGRGEEAERFQHQAQDLRREGPADSQLLIRVLLRTGRLAEARMQLEQLAEIERTEPVHKPRAHRETHLLLSIIYAMQGEPEAAYASALEGTQRGEKLASPFVTAVGYLRQGHALMMLTETGRFDRAIEKFSDAIELSRALHIPRIRIEAYWGLTRAYGFQGDLVEARRMATAGIEMAASVGDEWIASIIKCTLGACYVLAGDYPQGLAWLAQAQHGFQECSDPFGLASTRLWRCIGWFDGGELDLFADSFKLILEASLRHDFNSLLTRPTLLGVPDERRIVPLLLHAKSKGWSKGFPSRLLNEIGLGQIQLHPGYRLRIESMGDFKVWRGQEQIPASEWKREKSRQLLQVLIANRAAPLDRDQICECLWPGKDPQSSHRNFKVALNTLYQVLEPQRQAGSDSAYIVREGSTYALRPGADVWLDVEEIDQAVQSAEALMEEDLTAARSELEHALELYRGDFLNDARYETWAAGERERLTVQFLRCSDRLCELSLANDPGAVIGICQRVLLVDNCWERAYRYLMQAYAALGDHGQVARTFQNCIETLRQELDVAPAMQTRQLFDSLVQDSP